MKRAIFASLLLLFAAGCTSYYKVTDPTTDKTYYTNNVGYKRSGSAEFKDARTGAKVVLPSSEAQKIEKDEFNRGIYSR